MKQNIMAYILSYAVEYIFNTTTTSLLICLVVFLVAYRLINHMQSRLPPGPIGLPYIGSLITLLVSGACNEHPHDLITRLSKKYGKVFSIGFGGGSTLVFLNDYASVAEGFKNPSLSDRPPTHTLKTLLGASGIVNASGEPWKQQRRFSLGVFRNFGVGRISFEDDITTEANFLSDEIEALGGKQFNPRHYLMNATSNVICSVIFGKRFDYDDEELRRMLLLLDARSQTIGSGGLIAFVPVLRFISFRLGKRRVEILSETINFFKTIVNEHKERLKESVECNDFIDLFLQEIDKVKQQQSIEESFVNEPHLLAVIDTFFLAGTETSSNTLEWILLCMANYPDVQARIQEEIQSACGNQLPSFSDRLKMPYTEAVILEIQRLFTITPLGVPHYAGRDTTLQGHHIPEGTFILANIWGILHDPDVWSDPEMFKPERFLNAKGEVDIPVEWIPFSTGRRVCLGEKLAKMEMFILVTHILSKFSFHKPRGTTSMDFRGRSGAAYGPLPFEICANTRADK